MSATTSDEDEAVDGGVTQACAEVALALPHYEDCVLPWCFR